VPSLLAVILTAVVAGSAAPKRLLREELGWRGFADITPDDVIAPT